MAVGREPTATRVLSIKEAIVNGRPCQSMHPDPKETMLSCRLCFLFETRADYRETWGGNPAEAVSAPDPWQAGKPAAQPKPAPCRWLGYDTGMTVECPMCGGKIRLRVFACGGGYDCCTIDPTRPVKGTQCCSVKCPGYMAS